jgi:hypothetical protein
MRAVELPRITGAMGSSVLFYGAKSKDEAGRRLLALVEANKSMQETRRLLAAKYASLYEGLHLSGLAPYGYSADATEYFKDESGEQIPIIRNSAHSIVDTFVSKIAALETPKPAVMTTHGSWSERRIAKNLELLVEAEFYEPQGRFGSLEELWIHAVRIAAAATGSVAVKVCCYPNEPKVSHEIHDTLTMSFDFGELTYGDLLTVAETTWFDVDRLCEIFPGKANEEKIRRSIEKPPEEFRTPVAQGHITEMVALHEGWRGSHGGKCGKYCATVKEGTLEFKDYDYPKPPFVWFVVDPHLYGILGWPLTHHIYESVKRDNLIKQKVDRGVSKALRGAVFLDKSKLMNPEAMDVIDDDAVIDTTDPQAVQFVNAIGFNPAHLDVADRHYRDAHDISGVPEMHTSSKAQPGITAAIADRQVAARLNERFAACQRRYVQAVAVDDAKLIIQALREAREEHGKFTRLFPGEKFLKEITSDALDLDDHKFKLRIAAVSGRANTPEGRLQSAFELRQMGIFRDDSYAAAQSGFDTPEELDDIDTQREWLENEINRWLYAPDEDVEKPNFYRPPLKYMGLEMAFKRAIDGFMEAQIEELEEDRIEFFLLFLSDLDAALVQRNATAQQGGAPPGGAPGAAPQVGAGIAAPQLMAG